MEVLAEWIIALERALCGVDKWLGFLLSTSFESGTSWESLFGGGAVVLWVFGGMAVPLQPNKSAINTITNVTTMRNRWAAQRR